jgi:hypothetical protein
MGIEKIMVIFSLIFKSTIYSDKLSYVIFSYANKYCRSLGKHKNQLGVFYIYIRVIAEINGQDGRKAFIIQSYICLAN